MGVYDWVFVLAAIGSVLWLAWYVGRPSRDDSRHEEEAARAFFDRHGRWPDETDEDVERRMAAAAAADAASRRR